MTRITLFAFAALLVAAPAMAGPPAVPPGPASHSQNVSASVNGGFCSYVEPQQLNRCRNFTAWEERDPTSHIAQTRVALDQYRSGPNLYAYRHVDCPVASQALRVMPDKAFVKVTFDTEGPGCFAYGEMITFEPYSSVPWRYEGLATLEVDMLSPAMQERRVTSMTSVYNAAGTSTKDNCHGGAGWQAQAGGFTMIGLYQAFGPGAADGSFYYDTCGTTRK
jgi:hypothetical protein